MFNNQGNDLFKKNLEQGKKVLIFNEDMDKIVAPHLKLVQKGSIVEGMKALDLSTNDKKTMEGLQNVEDHFNQLLAAYTQTYKQFSEDLLNRSQTKKNIVNYLGKNIDAEGNIVYINNFGFSHQYSPDAWDDVNSSCSKNTKKYYGSMNEFQQGPNMTNGQPCGIAGQVIQNTDNSVHAWVDIKGYKHIFPEGTKMSDSCSKENIIKLSGNDFNLIPTGNSMSSTETCLTLDVNPSIWNRLNQLNTKLKAQAVKLTQEMNNLSLENEDAQQQLINKKKQLLNYIDNMDDDIKEIKRNKQMLVTASGEQEDSELRMTSNYYYYVIWIVLLFLIISLTMTTSVNNTERINLIVYAVIIIFVLMFLMYWYEKYKNGTI